MLTFVKETAPGTIISDVNLTLFPGLFVKAISQAHIGVYTSNAVANGNGSFPPSLKAKQGKPASRSWRKRKTRNIAQKEALISGPARQP